MDGMSREQPVAPEPLPPVKKVKESKKFDPDEWWENEQKSFESDNSKPISYTIDEDEYTNPSLRAIKEMKDKQDFRSRIKDAWNNAGKDPGNMGGSVKNIGGFYQDNNRPGLQDSSHDPFGLTQRAKNNSPSKYGSISYSKDSGKTTHNNIPLSDGIKADGLEGFDGYPGQLSKTDLVKDKLKDIKRRANNKLALNGIVGRNPSDYDSGDHEYDLKFPAHDQQEGYDEPLEKGEINSFKGQKYQGIGNGTGDQPIVGGKVLGDIRKGQRSLSTEQLTPWQQKVRANQQNIQNKKDSQHNANVFSGKTTADGDYNPNLSQDERIKRAFGASDELDDDPAYQAKVNKHLMPNNSWKKQDNSEKGARKRANILRDKEVERQNIAAEDQVNKGNNTPEKYKKGTIEMMKWGNRQRMNREKSGADKEYDQPGKRGGIYQSRSNKDYPQDNPPISKKEKARYESTFNDEQKKDEDFRKRLREEYLNTPLEDRMFDETEYEGI